MTETDRELALALAASVRALIHNQEGTSKWKEETLGLKRLREAHDAVTHQQMTFTGKFSGNMPGSGPQPYVTAYPQPAALPQKQAQVKPLLNEYWPDRAGVGG